MNINWYKIHTQLAVIKEALRTLEGYSENNKGKSIRSLVDHKISKLNEIVMLHPDLKCMLDDDDSKKKSSKRKKKNNKSADNNAEEISNNPVVELYKKQFNKKPRKDSDFGTCVITLPRILGRNESDFPDIANMDVEEAGKAMKEFYAGYEKGKDWLKTAVDCVIDLLKIRKEDILYVTLHVEETTLHIHVGFFPSYILKDKDGKERTDEDGNLLYGCTRSIVTRGFLNSFHKNTVKMMEEKGMPHADALITGEGLCFDPQKMSRKEREKAVRMLIEDEILQAKIDKGLIAEEEAEGRFHYKEYKQKNKTSLLKKKMNKSLDELQTQINDLKKQKSLLDLDLIYTLENFKSEVSTIIQHELEQFRIDALGMSQEEIGNRVTVIEERIMELVSEKIPVINEELVEDIVKVEGDLVLDERDDSEVEDDLDFDE